MEGEIVNKVVETMYKLGKDDSVQLTEDEKTAITLWKDVLKTDNMSHMINVSYDLFTKSGAVTQSNVSLEGTKNWIEEHHQKLWETQQEAQAENGTAIPPNAEPCLHFLCYLVCLCAVYKKLRECRAETMFNLFAENVKGSVVEKTGMPWETLKFIPKQSFFRSFMAQLGCILSQNVLAKALDWCYTGISHYMPSLKHGHKRE